MILLTHLGRKVNTISWFSTCMKGQLNFLILPLRHVLERSKMPWVLKREVLLTVCYSPFCCSFWNLKLVFARVEYNLWYLIKSFKTVGSEVLWASFYLGLSMLGVFNSYFCERFATWEAQSISTLVLLIFNCLAMNICGQLLFMT